MAVTQHVCVSCSASAACVLCCLTRETSPLCKQPDLSDDIHLRRTQCFFEQWLYLGVMAAIPGKS